MNQIALYPQFCGMQPFSYFINIRWDYEIWQYRLWSCLLNSNTAHEKKTWTDFAFKSKTHFPNIFCWIGLETKRTCPLTYKIVSLPELFHYVLCWMHNLELWYYRNVKKKWSVTVLPILAFYLQLDKVWGLSFTHFFSRSF